MEEQAVNNQVRQPNISTPPEPKHRSFLFNKLFLITLVIVVLFTMVYAGIYLYLGSQLDQMSKSKQITTTQPSPTSDPTAKWKTYTNTKYGFEFKHPSWAESMGTFESYFPGGSDLIFTLINGQILNNHEGVTVHSNIEVLYKLPNMSLQERLKTKYNIKDGKKGNIDTAYQQNQQLSEYYWTVMVPKQKVGTVIESPKGQLTYNEYLLNGIEIYEIGDPSVFSYMTFFIPKNKKYIYLLTLELSGAGNGKSVDPPDSYFIETYKQMVKTFKFLDQGDQAVCAQDVKTCPDGSYVSRQPPNCEFAACPQ